MLLYALPRVLGTENFQSSRQDRLITSLAHLKKGEKERQRRIQDLEKQICKLKEVLETPLETEDQEKLDAELVSQRRIMEGLPLKVSAEQYAKKVREAQSRAIRVGLSETTRP